MVNKNSGLSSLKNMFPDAKTEQSGTVNSKYGKIEGSVLLYKGVYYAIDYIAPGILVMQTDELFGEEGDEFPLELVR